MAEEPAGERLVSPSRVLSSRVALVVGGSRGIGAGIARAFAEAGADVMIASRDEAACRSTAEGIALDHGIRADSSAVDVRDAAGLDRLAVETVSRFEKIDILVFCSGIFRETPLLSAAFEDWMEVIDVNLIGAIRTFRVVAPRMAEAGNGTIIAITSLNAFRAGATVGAYGASKAALQMLTECLALEMAPHGVRVNAIAPGLTATDIHAQWLTDPGARRATAARIPLGRVMEPEDLGGAAVFLASDAAAMITGQTIVVDGGWTLPLESLDE